MKINHDLNFFSWTSQQQFSKDVLRKRCSENMQQIYMKTPIPKWDFNFIEITLRHGCSPVNMLHIFRAPFSIKHLWRATSDQCYYEFLLKWHSLCCSNDLWLTLIIYHKTMNASSRPELFWNMAFLENLNNFRK